MMKECKLILKEVSPPKVIGMIVKGENLFHVMKDLLNITNRVNQQQQAMLQKEEVAP